MSLNGFRAPLTFSCPNCNKKISLDLNDHEFESYYEETSENRMGEKIHYQTDIELECPRCNTHIDGEIIITEYPDGCLEGSSVGGALSQVVSEQSVNSVTEMFLS